MSAEHLAEAIEKAIDRKVALSKAGAATLPAEFVGKDGEGKPWVMLPGASFATPVGRMSVEAAPGDTVAVTVAGGTASVDSNISNPSAGVAHVQDVEKTADAAKSDAARAVAYSVQARAASDEAKASAEKASQDALSASASASQAVSDAKTARAGAESATADAARASYAASSAQESAESAQESATEANSYAVGALRGLSDVEKVVGTVQWIAEHGTYSKTADTSVVVGKQYYVKQNESYVAVSDPVDADIGTYYELDVSGSVQNYIASHLAQTDYGLDIMVDGTDFRMHLGTVDGTKPIGTYVVDNMGDTAAFFGNDGFQVGEAGKSHLVGDYHSFQLVDMGGSTYFHVSDLRGSDGKATVTETFIGDGSTTEFRTSIDFTGTLTVLVDGVAKSYTTRSVDTVILSEPPAAGAEVTITYKTESKYCKALSFGPRRTDSFVGVYSTASGYFCEASGSFSHAEGRVTSATGRSSHAEGDSTKAIGYYSHAEGFISTANGDYSHAEGYLSQANGGYSHAEGYLSQANGDYSHAEGYSTYANGDYSHAQNKGAVATGDSQTALGKYNVPDTTSAVIVGNGEGVTNRSNALALGWNGDLSVAGDMTDGAGHVLSEKADAADLQPIQAACTADTAWLSNADATRFFAVRAGNIGYLRGTGVKLAQALPVNTNCTVGTLPSNFIPYVPAQGLCCAFGSLGKIVGTCSVDTDGNIILRNLSGAAVASGTNLYLSTTYIIA